MVIPLHDDNPTERFPFVTVAIIALNVFVYLLIQPHSGVDTRLGTSRDTAFTLEHAAIPCELNQGEPATVRELNTGSCTAAARTTSATSDSRSSTSWSAWLLWLRTTSLIPVRRSR